MSPYCTSPTLTTIDIISTHHSYKIGETFVRMPLPQALKRLECDQKEVEKHFSKAAGEVEEIETQLGVLKSTLYRKFGKAINLEE